MDKPTDSGEGSKPAPGYPDLIGFLKKWLAVSTPRQKLTAGLLAFSLLATGALFALTSDPATSTDPLSTSPFYFFSVFIKLIGVLLLIVGSAALYRRWMTPGAQNSRIRQLRVLETVRLGPKQALHLVAIGDQRVLIGATDQAIALISHLEGNASPVPVEIPQPSPEFSVLLQSMKG